MKITALTVYPENTIREVIACIDRNEKGIALVVDEDRHLLATLTDGDIRRAILAGFGLDERVHILIEKKAQSAPDQPVTADIGTPRAELLKCMKENAIRQLPLLDSEGRVADLVTLAELVPDQFLPLQAVIMAGGSGTRLRPLTEDLPKPMLPVGDRPLMEVIIEQLRQSGIGRVNITTHYLPDKITDYFGNGENFGVELNYVSEDRPLGTAGSLGLINWPRDTLLVINGDILTKVNFRAMLDYHHEHGADITVGVRKYDLQVPYGVVECEDQRVSRLREKPSLSFFVNAGIYMLEPRVNQHIPNGEHYDMTDLIDRLIQKGRPVVSFPIVEYWLDIGEPSDYARAQEDVKNGGISI
jgi:dTDP-glucose pyrophosphorylase/CBS domain-containing protein